MDELKELCNTIEKCEKDLCEKNRIVCVRKCLSEYISDDRDKFLRLKAQVEIHRKFDGTVLQYLSFLLAGISVICSLLNIVILFVPEENIDCELKFVVCGLVIIIILFLWMLVVILKKANKKNSNVDKLVEYVSVVLEEMDKK